MPKKRSKKNWEHPLYRQGFIRNRDGYCQLEININKNRIRKNIGLAFNINNKKLALDILEEEILKQVYGIKQSPLISLKEAFNKFLDVKKSTSKESTIKRYNYAFNSFVSVNNDVLLENSDDLKNLIITNVTQLQMSQNTKNRLLVLLKGFFDFCVEQNYIAANPITKAFIPKMKLENPDPYSDDEIDKILDYFFKRQNELYDLIDFINNSGLRISEAVSITRNDYRNNTLFIPANISKGNKERYIPLATFPKLKNILDKLSQNKQDKLFKWDSPFYALQTLRIACTRLKIKPRGYHGFRKAFENRLILSGYPVNLVAQILGHTLAIQQKYYVKILGVKDLQNALNNVRDIDVTLK